MLAKSFPAENYWSKLWLRNAQTMEFHYLFNYQFVHDLYQQLQCFIFFIVAFLFVDF